MGRLTHMPQTSAASKSAASIDVAMHSYFPELMMHRPELTQVRRLLRGRDRVRDQSTADQALPRREQKGWDHFRTLLKRMEAQLDAICAEVWKREVGLERFTVLHGQRGDYEARFQLLSFSVSDSLRWRGEWLWQLDGRALRKDGTLGDKDSGMGFRCAHFMRRHLDGSWSELRPPDAGARR